MCHNTQYRIVVYVPFSSQIPCGERRWAWVGRKKDWDKLSRSTEINSEIISRSKGELSETTVCRLEEEGLHLARMASLVLFRVTIITWHPLPTIRFVFLHHEFSPTLSFADEREPCTLLPWPTTSRFIATLSNSLTQTKQIQTIIPRWTDSD